MEPMEHTAILIARRNKVKSRTVILPHSLAFAHLHGQDSIFNCLHCIYFWYCSEGVVTAKLGEMGIEQHVVVIVSLLSVLREQQDQVADCEYSFVAADLLRSNQYECQSGNAGL